LDQRRHQEYQADDAIHQGLMHGERFYKQSTSKYKDGVTRKSAQADAGDVHIVMIIAGKEDLLPEQQGAPTEPERYLEGIDGAEQHACEQPGNGCGADGADEHAAAMARMSRRPETAKCQ